MRKKQLLAVGILVSAGAFGVLARPAAARTEEDKGVRSSAHLAANQTYVIDLSTDKVIATVTDTPGVEGVEYVPELKKIYTSNSGDDTIGVVDVKQMKVIKKLKTERKPDGSAYAAPFHKFYVSDERGKAEATKSLRPYILTVRQECRSTILLPEKSM